MMFHRSRRPTSSDSGYSSTASTPSHDRIKDFVPSEPVEPIGIKKTKTHTAESGNKLPFSIAARTDLTASIGTQLSNVQLTRLDLQELDELALLVSERGVVFFREQNLTQEDQLRIFDHIGKHGKQIIEREQGRAKIKTGVNDFGEVSTITSGSGSEWVSERSFEVNPSSYSMLKAEETGGDTAWVSQYGLYDKLSRPAKRFVDDLPAIHTSRLQFDSIRDLRGMPRERSPVETHHPAVRTHPVTGLKALNVTPGAVTGFAELSKRESDKLLELLEYNTNSSDEHTVRFRWEAGSVAIWDNRCTAYKHISSDGFIKGFKTSSVGEKPYFQIGSESRDEQVQRLARENEEERVRIEETKRRFNNTPLRRILRRQASGAPSELNTTDVSGRGPSIPQPPTEQRSQPQQPLFRPRSNSEIREQEQKIWDQTSSNTEKPRDRQPLFKLRSNDEIRELEQRIWAKSVTPLEIAAKSTSPDSKRPTAASVSSNGSPLRRIIQRQASGGPGARRRDWK